MAIDKENYLEIARSRYTQQFKDKPNFDKLIATWLEESEDLQSTISAIDDIKYIDKCSGVQLDNIGEIVGQPRLLIDADLIAFFGFTGQSISRSYGDLNDASKGGRWYSLDESTTGNISLQDTEYRLFLKAKIIRNTTVATTEDVIDSLKFLFGASKVHLIEGESPATYSAAIGAVLSQQEKNLLKYDYQEGVKRTLVVKPAGVRVDNYREFNPEQFFGFQGVREAKGFGDLKEIADYVPYYETFGMYGFGSIEQIASTSEEVTTQTFQYSPESVIEINPAYEGPLGYFGFSGAEGAKGFGDLNSTDYQTMGRYRSIEQDPNDFGLVNDFVEIPISKGNVQITVYLDNSVMTQDQYSIGDNRVYFNSPHDVGSIVKAEQSEVFTNTTTTYSLNDPSQDELTRVANESSFGDINNPSIGSRYKSFGESDDTNNIIYEGPIKKIEYINPEVTTLSVGGYYSSIVN